MAPKMPCKTPSGLVWPNIGDGSVTNGPEAIRLTPMPCISDGPVRGAAPLLKYAATLLPPVNRENGHEENGPRHARDCPTRARRRAPVAGTGARTGDHKQGPSTNRELDESRTAFPRPELRVRPVFCPLLGAETFVLEEILRGTEHLPRSRRRGAVRGAPKPPGAADHARSPGRSPTCAPGGYPHGPWSGTLGEEEVVEPAKSLGGGWDCSTSRRRRRGSDRLLHGKGRRDAPSRAAVPERTAEWG